MHLCLAYPNIDANDRELIHDFRRLHDAKYVDVVPPHWTMIFPGSTRDIDSSDLHDHIARVAGKFSPIDFVCRYALVYDDDGSDDYYIFLVPDEGFSQISLLHDALYSGIMRPYLRLDIPYVPHVGIATSTNKDHLYRLATDWNNQRREIRGRIDSLTLSSYDGNRVEDITHFKLTKSDPGTAPYRSAPTDLNPMSPVHGSETENGATMKIAELTIDRYEELLGTMVVEDICSMLWSIRRIEAAGLPML